MKKLPNRVLSGNDISCEEDGERKKNEEIFHAAINVVKESGRDQDFLAVLEGLASGALNPHNIAVQLFLEIGAFLSAETVNNVRYSSLTLNFWTLVKKLFHGKATNFFGDTVNPLYLANLANLTFPLIFKDAKLKRRQQYFFYTKISTLPSRLNKCM